MKKILISAAILSFLAPAAYAQLKLPRVSQKASVSQTVGLTDVTITYSRPGVKGRVIWGGLVPYDEVWRTGANEATAITFSQDVTINGKPLPAGTYSLHTIPRKTAWTLIFNKKADQWGSYEYDASQDALRIEVQPVTGPDREWMEFSFADVQRDSATVELAWEKLRVPFRIETQTTKQALANIRQALAGEVKEWNVPYSAASFAFNANLDNRAEMMRWIDQSLSLKETFWNLRLKAAMLEKEGQKKDAIAVAEKAVTIGKANKDNESEVARTEKQVAEWKASLGK
jgi:predicted S18 family serine protease